MEYDSLGYRVKLLRKQKKLTQTDLGKLSGIHYTNIGRIENKNVIPQADVLHSIATCLETSVSWLLTGEVDSDATSYSESHGSSCQEHIIQLLEQLSEDEKKELLTYMKDQLNRRS